MPQFSWFVVIFENAHFLYLANTLDLALINCWESLRYSKEYCVCCIYQDLMKHKHLIRSLLHWKIFNIN